MLVVRRVHFTMRHSSCNTAVLTRNLEALQPDAMPHCRTKSAPAPPFLLNSGALTAEPPLA